MSKVNKSKSIPVDHEAAAQEAERRETLAANESHATRVRAAEAGELSNRRGELTASFADLQRMKSGRGNLAALRAGYDRCYKRIERLASTVAGITGERIEIPEYDPPQVLSTKTRFIGPPPSTAKVIVRDDGTTATIDPATTYKERGGKGPSGRGTAGIPIPGSAADHNWVQK